MPIYEYECPSCKATFEEILLSSSTRAIYCNNCNTEAKRIVSHSSFQLKGEGWYTTEYGKNSASSTPKPSGSEGSNK